jgi:TonB family protein
MAQAGFGGGRSDSRALGTTVSIGAHAVLLGLILFGAAHAPRGEETRAVPIAPFELEFLNRPGRARGGGGSDARIPEPPGRVEIPAVEHRRLSPIPNPSDVPPVSVVTIPVATVNAVDMLPGTIGEIAGMSPVRGSGRGVGEGDGPGVGPGQKGGFGGNTFSDGGNGVTSPRLIKEIKPNYTADAVRAKVQGSVLLEAVVLPDGSVDPNRVRIVRSLDAMGLDQQAVVAVKGWQFRPGTFEGKPVAVRVHVELTFTLR